MALSIRLWGEASLGAEHKTVVPALTIVAAGLIPVALLSLAISRARPGRAQVAVRP